jgi:CheY-like chemotaxis protein
MTSRPSPTDTSPKTAVLIADDDPDLLFTLRAHLQADGYQVLAAPDGSAALAGQQLPPLPILDVVMPVMDGFELARGGSAATPATPVTSADREVRLHSAATTTLEPDVPSVVRDRPRELHTAPPPRLGAWGAR